MQTISNDYPVGRRVEIHPALDAWMAGDRYGEIVRVTTKRVHVRMDRSGRTLKLGNLDQYPVTFV